MRGAFAIRHRIVEHGLPSASCNRESLDGHLSRRSRAFKKTLGPKMKKGRRRPCSPSKSEIKPDYCRLARRRFIRRRFSLGFS